MVEAETMVKYLTLTIYVAPLVFSLPFFFYMFPITSQGFSQLTSLQNAYAGVTLFYVGAMYIVEIGWSSIDVALNGGGRASNVTFAALLFAILAAGSIIFGNLIFFNLYQFNNLTYNIIILGLIIIGLAMYGWQARKIISESVRSNHIFTLLGEK